MNDGPLAPLAGSGFETEARCATRAGRRVPRARPGDHRGLSGPRSSKSELLQAQATGAAERAPVTLDLLPGLDARAWSRGTGLQPRHGSRTCWPRCSPAPRPRWCALHGWDRASTSTPRRPRASARALNAWTLMPSGTLRLQEPKSPSGRGHEGALLRRRWKPASAGPVLLGRASWM